MKYINQISIISLMLFSCPAYSGISDSTITNGYIQDMNNHLAIKMNMNSSFQEFRLTSDPMDFHIKPNIPNYLKLSVNYRFISLSFSTAPKFIPGNRDNDLKGDTKSFSLGVNLSFNHWIQSLTYEKIKGFYLVNTADFNPGWVSGTDEYYKFPDLAYNGFQGYTAYKFNEKFSLSALDSQTERQLKNVGSFMGLLSYLYYIMDDKIELTGQNSSQKSNNFELMISGEYFHTFVIRESFYFSTGIGAGGGLIFTKLLTRMPEGEYTDHNYNPIMRLLGNGALGYNSERVFAGGQLKVSMTRFNQNNTSSVILNDRIAYQLFFGYRFNAPARLRSATDKAENLKKISVEKLHRKKKPK